MNEISVPDILFEEFVLDIPDDSELYASRETENGTTGRAWSNIEASLMLNKEQNGGDLSAAALDEAAATSVKPDKHFDLFKEATAANSCQVLY